MTKTEIAKVLRKRYRRNVERLNDAMLGGDATIIARFDSRLSELESLVTAFAIKPKLWEATR